MKKKYILVLTFLFVLCGQSSFGQTIGAGDSNGFSFTGTNPLDEVTINTKTPTNNSIKTDYQLDEVTIYSYGHSASYYAMLWQMQNPVDYRFPDFGTPYSPEQYYGSYSSVTPTAPITYTPPPVANPCDRKTALENTANQIPKDKLYSAGNSLTGATSTHNVEHGITFGKDATGQITQAPMRNDGGLYNVPVTQNWPGAFAAVHNHVVNTPPSTGDIYAAVTLNSNNPNFTTSYINLPDGSSYSIVVTNPVLAKAFTTEFPSEKIGNNSPEFPDVIFYEIQDYIRQTGQSVKGKIDALVIMLNNHNAGISVLQKNSNNDYEKITIKQTIKDGVKTFQYIICP